MLMSKPLQVRIPSGKTLKTANGRREFTGPMILDIDSTIRLSPAFCDGTQWRYYHHELALEKNTEEAGQSKSDQPKTQVKSKSDSKKKDKDATDVAPETISKTDTPQKSKDNTTKGKADSGD